MDSILQDANVPVIAVAAVGLFAVLAIVFFLFTRGKKRTVVVIFGLCDSGKTLLHYRLLYGEFRKTYSSITENSAKYIVPGKGSPLDLVDIPGHDRVRIALLTKYIKVIRGLVVLVDGVNFPREYVDVAAMLYDLFSNKKLMSTKAPVLIACNKQDVSLAKDTTFIKEQLETEINRLRTSRGSGAALEGTSGDSSQHVFVGKRERDFDFADLPCPVQFVSCSARGSGAEEDSSKPDVDSVQQWLQKL